MEAIGDRSAYQQVGDLVGEVIISHQPEGIIWCWCEFKKLPVAAEHEKQAVS
ncbi:hypothetical protein [Mesorhizobium sp. Root157]|uniref:hypothetical protein n=1 Tax=Mesorhizobium sp. Root157 TaxID=1736477 RepID=UPI0012E39856|nr:hypothetical protein [Mesorhizobium sp. Root157]